jgi:alpha-tubulin suppressor-like RCC1 family protein
MKNYSKVEHMKFSVAMPVLLLSAVLMLTLSGCGGNEHGISGTITSGGSPLPGVTVTLSGNSSMVTTTDANGKYSFSDLSDVTDIITPSLAGYTFRPASRTAYIYGEDAAGFNFYGVSLSSVAATLHTVYLKNDGTVWTWGSNSNGQLGNNSTTDSHIPVQVGVLSGMTVIAAGNNFTVAVKNDGTVWAWGSNSNGQLGNGTNGPGTDSNIPVQVSGTSGLSGVVGVAAGSNHTVALTSSGAVWAWGGNGNGQLGNGTTTDSNIPLGVGGLASIMAIAAGNNFTVALKNVTLDSSVLAWGSNNNGQLGNGTTTDVYVPVQVSGMVGTGAIGIAAGFDHAVAMKTDGTVWTWGGNSNGQLGNGTTTGSVTPVQVSGMSGVAAVAAGEKDTVTFKIDSTVWAWGYNFYGQLGNNSTTDSSIPVQALLP